MNSVVSYLSQKTQKKRERGKRKLAVAENGVSSERERGFSLNFQEIRSSEFVGTRSKVALRIETYAWAPVLGVFDKLREVGDLSYLGFTLYLSVL